MKYDVILTNAEDLADAFSGNLGGEALWLKNLSHEEMELLASISNRSSLLMAALPILDVAET